MNSEMNRGLNRAAHPGLCEIAYKALHDLYPNPVDRGRVARALVKRATRGSERLLDKAIREAGGWKEPASVLTALQLLTAHLVVEEKTVDTAASPAARPHYRAAYLQQWRDFQARCEAEAKGQKTPQGEGESEVVTTALEPEPEGKPSRVLVALQKLFATPLKVFKGTP